MDRRLAQLIEANATAIVRLRQLEQIVRFTGEQRECAEIAELLDAAMAEATKEPKLGLE